MMAQPYVDGITDTVPHDIASTLTASQIEIAADGMLSIWVVCPDRWFLGDVAMVTSRDGHTFAGQVRNRVPSAPSSISGPPAPHEPSPDRRCGRRLPSHARAKSFRRREAGSPEARRLRASRAREPDQGGGGMRAVPVGPAGVSRPRRRVDHVEKRSLSRAGVLSSMSGTRG